MIDQVVNIVNISSFVLFYVININLIELLFFLFFLSLSSFTLKSHSNQYLKILEKKILIIILNINGLCYEQHKEKHLFKKKAISNRSPFF